MCSLFSMAERQEERNIQRIVAAVISNLHSVSSLSEASSSSGNSSNRFGSREEEIRNAFSIPRDAASPATVENGVDGNEASSSSQNTPVAGSSSFQCASFPSTSRPIPLSTNYSHLRNYSQGKGKIRKGKQAARSTSTGRFEKGPGSGLRVGKENSASRHSKMFACCLRQIGELYPDLRRKPILLRKAYILMPGLFRRHTRKLSSGRR